MHIIAILLVGLVALEHLYILYLEMFLWTTPRAMKSFGLTQDFAIASKTLAANQGLYNGFLAAGLVWSIFHPNPDIGQQIAIFFLLCVIIAGVYGGLTAKRSILYIQAAPAAVALAAVLLF
jgi:putative membrane protein